MTAAATGREHVASDRDGLKAWGQAFAPPSTRMPEPVT